MVLPECCLPSDLSENMSDPQKFLRPLPPWGTLPPVIAPLRKVGSLCMCNFAGVKVRQHVDGPSRVPGHIRWSASGEWVWNRNPCACIGTMIFQKYAQEGGELECGYVRETDMYRVIPCIGRGFIYLSTSTFSGRYACSGHPPTCRYFGVCRGYECLRPQ